ncbi:unnamed protein product [Candidula unifasciata]|uniref:Uncharacterized protein n=1 Tax=Candidula unifasciata TaxID=100452 RepID=A0A8S3YXJ3_9EUPU|nr:unnamed protein product [Candidula unifasciata]
MADLERVLKRLPDDVVEYSVFPLIPDDLPSERVSDFLEKFADTVLAHLSDRIVDYIWQHESFNLRPIVSPNDSVPPHLHGSTSFGDNIEDEWFIVYLLYEITREYAGTVVRVNDNDEEFLLIEAANELPKWLNPESAENRVYIYNGDLHVIPIPQTAEESSRYPLFTPTVAEAVACVRDCACETRCSQAVQNMLNKRLSCFPRKTAESIHRVNCYLPTPLAVLLADQPSLVSAGVRSFYYRDPLELKACRPMKRFKPSDLVRTRVKMTRCLYAQLVQQQFIPDRSSGWPVIAPSNPQYSEQDVGMKLAHGFEILCSRYRDVDNASSAATALEDSNPRWQQFKKSLASKGYFRGEIEGSVLYKKLLQDAKQFYQSQIHAGENGIESTGQLVLRHLKLLEPKFEEFRQAERQLPPSDDDSWINVTPEQLDEMMKTAGGLSSSDGLNLFKVAESMTAFVEHESGIEGAEFPKESAENDGADGQFESSGLIQAMQKIFEFPDDEDSTGSDMSEYDWSEGSDDELGSPSKMPKTVKKSSLKKAKVPKAGDQNGGLNHRKSTSKSVRFSTPDSALTLNPAVSSPETVTSTPPVPATSQDAASSSSVNRPTNLIPTSHGQSDLSSATKSSSRPTCIPPPVPARPPRQKEGFKPLNKPSSVVKPSAPPPPPPPAGEKRDKKLVALMEAMDRELAATDVGKSFEREPKQPRPKRTSRPPPPSRPTKSGPKAAQKNIEDEDDDFQPVNIDLTVVKNTLESYKAQQGLPGPASNILAAFGIKLPQDQVNGKT